jgi:PAS domain S-box-containing protein
LPALAQDAAHFEAIVSSSDDAILSKDREGTITFWNPAAERLYGYTSTEAVGRPVSIIIPPERAGEEREILARALRGEGLAGYETERLTKDGGRVFVSLTVSPVRLPGGDIAGASVIARDIAERRGEFERAERLQEVTFRLAREIRPEQTVAVLLDHALPALGADAGAVGLIDRRSGILELAGSRGYSPGGVARFRQMPLDAGLPMTDVVRSGEPLWLTNSDELWPRYSTLPGTRSEYASIAIVPLTAGDRPFGAVSLSFDEPHRFSLDERAFVVSIAAQAASALERARLFDDERRRREQLEVLVEASEALVSTLDVDITLERLAALAVPRIADWCSVDLAADEGPRNVTVAHADPARRALARQLRRRYPPDPSAPTGIPNVLRTGLPELYSEIPEELLVEAAEDEEHLRLLRELGMVSGMVVPLVVRGATLGALTLVSAESGHHYTDEDLVLAEELARHAALAIDNASLYRREHDAAVALQRALLPAQVRPPAGVEVAVRYLPAAPGLEVGGDWYDLVVGDHGSLAVVVGDVAGRGIQAAAVMGRLRIALRAYILDGHAPADAVRRLDALMDDLDEPSMATLVHLALDTANGRTEYVIAGHPPPLLRERPGEVRTLGGQLAPPIGVGSRRPLEASSLTLAPGATLLLYTDGLIEQRAEGIGGGLATLREVFAAAPDDVEACADAVVERLASDALDDDAAVLVLRFLDWARIPAAEPRR